MRIKSFLLSLGLVMIACGIFCPHRQAAASSSLPTPLPSSLAPMLTRCMEAVVNVAAQGSYTASLSMPSNNPLRKFGSIGSGVVWNAQAGYIITNAHVLKHAQTITVTVHDGRRLPVKIVGVDEASDIALLQTKAPGLHAVELGNSDQVQVGDFVVAIGNPFGLDVYGTSQTATFGMVSALQRSEIRAEGVDSFIQTDAAINPGNSGGALVNLQGQLIGINTAIISPTTGNVGVGLAIPVNTVRDVVEQLIQYGTVHRGLMGVYVQHLTPELAEAMGIRGQQGAVVTQVNPNSPAAQTGLKAGDVIQALNGKTIRDAAQVKNLVGLLRVGSRVQIVILRDAKRLELTAQIEDIKKHEARLQSDEPFLFGLGLQTLDQFIPVQGRIQGVQVIGTLESSAAFRAGIRPGDVIVEANRTPVKDLQTLRQIAANTKKQLLLRVLRGGGAFFVNIQQN